MNWYKEATHNYDPIDAIKRIDAKTLTEKVLRLHYGDLKTAEEEESDLPERIGKYPWYDLKQITISQIPNAEDPDASPFLIREKKIERIVRMIEKSHAYPPIVVNIEGEVEDGNHRVFALKELGAVRVWAYVPSEEKK